MSGDVLTYALRPVAFVRSPYRDASEIPKGPGAEHHAEGILELRPELEPGLRDIEGFSHLFVLWVFDRAGACELVTSVPLDPDSPHGVFASRSPRRPNPIGLSVVELLGREGSRLRVRGVDMLDGTPVLDIKPYLSSVPPEKLRRGWVAEAEAKRKGSGVDPRGNIGDPTPRRPSDRPTAGRRRAGSGRRTDSDRRTGRRTGRRNGSGRRSGD